MSNEVSRTSKELDALIRRVNALIPSSVTPATRIEIHPCDWLILVDAARASNEPSNGYVDAYYKVAELLGLTTAMPISPMEVFETVILPRLRELVSRAAQPPGALPKFKVGDAVVWNNLLGEQRAGTVEGVNVIPRYAIRPAGSTYLVDLNEPDLKPAPTKHPAPCCDINASYPDQHRAGCTGLGEESAP